MGEDEKGPYVAMEYVRGRHARADGRPRSSGAQGSLRARRQDHGRHLRRPGVSSMPRATRRGRRWARFTGDVSPSNIIVTMQGVAKLIDVAPEPVGRPAARPAGGRLRRRGDAVRAHDLAPPVRQRLAARRPRPGAGALATWSGPRRSCPVTRQRSRGSCSRRWNGRPPSPARSAAAAARLAGGVRRPAGSAVEPRCAGAVAGPAVPGLLQPDPKPAAGRCRRWQRRGDRGEPRRRCRTRMRW